MPSIACSRCWRMPRRNSRPSRVSKSGGQSAAKLVVRAQSLTPSLEIFLASLAALRRSFGTVRRSIGVLTRRSGTFVSALDVSRRAHGVGRRAVGVLRRSIGTWQPSMGTKPLQGLRSTHERHASAPAGEGGPRQGGRLPRKAQRRPRKGRWMHPCGAAAGGSGAMAHSRE